MVDNKVTLLLIITAGVLLAHLIMWILAQVGVG